MGVGFTALARVCVVAAGAAIPCGATSQVAVTEGGTPSYSHPIVVPPGVAGMAPNLALMYSGSSVNGPVGLGWTVQGISLVTRCPSTKAVDNVSRAVDYTAADKLCLDGQRLIRVNPGTITPTPSPTEGDAQGVSAGFREYRTEKDTFARVRAYGSAGSDSANGPAYFRAWTKSGQVYEYGDFSNAAGNSRIAIQGKPAISAWAVSRISDTLGNYIDFRYEQRPVTWGSGDTVGVRQGREWNLREVLYTGNSNSAQVPMNRVVFEYTDRPADATDGPSDRSEAYHLGGKTVSVQRLTTVKTYTNSSGAAALQPSTAIEARATLISYERSPVTGRSRVVELKDCAGAGFTKCLPAVTFDYAEGGNLEFEVSTAFQASLGGADLYNQFGAHGVVVLDFDGDGRSDLLHWASTVANNKLYRSNGDGSFTQVSVFNITDQRLFTADGCYVTMVVDMNGDGIADLLRYSGPKTLDDEPCGSYGPTYVYIGSGSGTFTRYNLVGPSLERLVSNTLAGCLNPQTCLEPDEHNGNTRGANFFLLDVNGDGRVDIVTTVLPYWAIQATTATPCSGVTCTRVWEGNGTGTFTERSTNIAGQSLYVPPVAGTGFGAPRNVMDFDGDGLADIVGIGDNNTASTFGTYRSTGDFNFVSAGAVQTCLEPLDVNGDGRMDCLRAFTIGSVSTNSLRISDGTATGFWSDGFNLKTEPLEAAGIGHVLADFNGDGRTDILRWKDNPADNEVYISHGDGSFKPSTSYTAAFDKFNLTSPADILSKSTAEFTLLTGDFTGRGHVELLRLMSGPANGRENRLYVRKVPAQPDLLVSVTSGTGLMTDLTWVTLASSSSGSLGARYVSDRGTSNEAQYPYVDIGAAMPVVATMAADSGVSSGGTRLRSLTEFHYRGLKAAYDGHGARGFREVRRRTSAANGSNVTVVTEYLQAPPYIGVASSTRTYVADLTVNTSTTTARSTSLYTYCEKSVQASAATATPTNPCSVAGGLKVVRPYLARSVESGIDIDAANAVLPTVTTVNTFNDFGDPLIIDVTTSGNSVAGTGLTSRRVTTNTYNSPVISDTAWVVGRLDRSEQENTVTDSFNSAALAVSPGSAPRAAAITGVAPAATLSTPSFAATQVNSSRNAVATFTNTGTVAVALAVPSAESESITGAAFAFLSTTCEGAVAPGAACTITVRFSPTVAGTATGTLRVVTGPDTYTVNLTGTGQAPTATLGSLAFGPVAVGTPSTLTSTLRNSGVGTISVTVPTAASVTGADFNFVSTTCGTSLTAGQTCTVSVRFLPTSAVARTGSLVVGTGAGSITANLSGTGAQPNATASPTTLSYGATNVGATSAPLAVTVTNTGAVALTVSAVSATGDFSVSANTCTSVPANGTCTVSVRFAPTAAGNRTGTLTITNNGTSGNRTVSLSGTGNPAAVLALSPTSVAISEGGGLTKLSATITLTNQGPGTVSAVTLPIVRNSGTVGDVSVSANTCTSLAQGASCTFRVLFESGCPTAATSSWTLNASATGATNTPTLGITGTTQSGACI